MIVEYKALRDMFRNNLYRNDAMATKKAVAANPSTITSAAPRKPGKDGLMSEQVRLCL